jgi:hypothetical protein
VNLRVGFEHAEGKLQSYFGVPSPNFRRNVVEHVAKGEYATFTGVRRSSGSGFTRNGDARGRNAAEMRPRDYLT